MKTIYNALKTVLSDRLYRWITGIAFLLFLTLYLFTLPSSFTGGQIGLMAFEFLDTTMIITSIIMAALAALVIAFIVYLFKRGMHASKSSAVGGVAVGLLTPILCCSPLIPILFGALAGLLPSLGGTFGPRVQAFIATHQTELFIVATVLLLLALYLNAKKIIAGASCSI